MEILHPSLNFLEELFQKAEKSERKRALSILRSSDKGEIPAIMFIASLPGTYLRPHRHPLNDGREILVALSGRMKIILFHEDGKIKETCPFSPAEVPLVELPAGIYHTVITLEPSAICELYLGIYDPATYKEFAPWAPPENDPAVADYLKKLSGN